MLYCQTVEIIQCVPCFHALFLSKHMMCNAIFFLELNGGCCYATLQLAAITFILPTYRKPSNPITKKLHSFNIRTDAVELIMA